jgi:outer membrane biosynthesis protein TonB
MENEDQDMYNEEEEKKEQREEVQ